MFIKKKYSNRHQILKVLQEYFESKDRADLNDSKEVELTFTEIVKKSNLSENEVRQQLDYLQKEDELCINNINFSTYYFILRNGTISYHDKKYLNIGKKEFFSNTYDIIKTLSAIILLIIAVVTFINNLSETKTNKKQIEILKTEINDMKYNLKSEK